MQNFDGESLTELIKKLVMIDADWIPKEKGYSLYIRTSPFTIPEHIRLFDTDGLGPTLIGTQAQLGVGPNSDALLFVICSPVSLLDVA
jgi:branched-chain amino acid aminotransferase